MPYDLKGRNVLVTGGSRGLGEHICLLFAQAGANVAINYASSEDRARALASKIESQHGGKAIVLQGDMGVEANCIGVVESAIRGLGGLDVVISNAGYTRFSTFSDLNAPTVEDWDKCFAVNVKAQTHLLKAASATFNANEEGGVFIMSSSIAGIKASGSSMPYSVTKAAQLHLMKCLATTQGPKIRVNAILPGILLTEWGLLYPEEKIESMKKLAALKKVTDLRDCAMAYLDLARNSSMTGQAVAVDSGLATANI